MPRDRAKCSKMSEIVKEFIKLYNMWSGIVFALQFLAFVAYLNSNYVPTPENAITYCLTLIVFLLLNAVASAIEGVVISGIINFVKNPFK